jgi:hypothetical protein
MTIQSDQIRQALANLIRRRTPFHIPGGPTLFISRPSFGDVWIGGSPQELIQRHVVTEEGFPVFRDAGEVDQIMPGDHGAAVFEFIQKMYDVATNPPTPSGGSSPSLGASG